MVRRVQRLTAGPGVRSLGALLLVLLAFGLVAPAVANDLPDPENPTAVLEIDKTVSATDVGPGDELVYTIEVGCSAISDVGCRDAITTDVVPEPFVIDAVTPSGPNDAAPPEIDGQDVTVTWTEGIGAGATGMLDNTTSQVTITAHVPEDVSYDFNGVTVTNEALAEATNATDVPDSVDVTITVPLDLATSATKAFDPDTALAAAGTPVTASLTGTNDSNATVETLVIQDPIDPTATPNPFTYLGFTGFGTVTPPEGTTSTTYEVFVDPGGWTPAPGGELPAGVDPEDVQGTRVTFTGAIPAGATGAVDLELETTEEAAAVPEDTVVTNDIQSQVTLDGESATGPAADDFTLQANNINVAASKTFDPELVLAGESSTVTLGARNASPFPIDTLTITEPSAGSFPPEYTFGGFSAGIAYPAGATSGTVIYQPGGEEVAFADGSTPAPPSGGAASVTSFEIVFTGDIQPGAETSVSFDVDTDPDLDPADLPASVANEVAVEGENDGATGDATAEDDLFIYGEVIEPYIDKQVRPSQIIANPGEIVTVTLQGGTTERPNPPDDPTGTTGAADQIVIQDPLDPVEPNAWWNAFDLNSITQTPIPADSTLTVFYWDTTTDEWVLLDGPVAGPDIYSFAVPDDVSAVAGGIRFQYDYTGTGDGFAPGTDLTPNFTSSLRGQGRYDGAVPPYNTDPDEPNTLIPNCGQTTASSPAPGVPDATAELEPPDCPEIEIIPLDGEGVGDLIEKEYGASSSGGNKSVIARSGDTIPSTLFWSTGGYSGFQTVELTDVADPDLTTLPDSVYDAFNLIRVEAISAAQDPYLTYDQITGVELFIGGEWVPAANNPCPAACDGTFPGMDLTPTEQGGALSVRLTYAESPTRADRSDLDAPPVGSGVARSIGNDRQVTLTWQVRDTKRSDGSPALGEDLYNLPDPGLVRNTARATGFPESGDLVTDQDADDVAILDVPITTTTEKDWLGGPVAVPSPGTPEDQYPRTRMRVTTTNTTPARVDQMQIVDPAPGSTTDPLTDPFDYFTLVRISSINVPAGTESTTVTLTCPTDPQPDPYTREEALALTPATMPCDVTGFQVLFDGRLASGADGVVTLDMRLRADNRETGEPITPADSPITNTAEGVVADIDAIQDCPPPADARYACDQDTATVDIVAPTFGINAGKSISPATQTEGDFSPVTVTVSAQNSGSARPYVDTITDDDPTFWNAVDFVQMDPSWTLPEPVEFVQACYLSGGTFTDATVVGDAVGGDLTCQELPGGGPPFEPGDLTLEQARAFIDDAAASGVDIHGLQLSFMAGDEVGWQNPANPLIQVPFQVERRVDLRSGGPVPTTRSDQAAAPGEAEAGIFVDTVEVEGQSVLVGADTRLEASDTADASYTHDHLTVGVEVDKTPAGEVQPGQVIPFELTYTNTGQAPLTNPVFTDVLPTDAEGPMLIFDPDSDPTINSPYSFELTGAAPDPPNGDPLPTDQDEITITETGDTITFEMPDGTVLEPGQTYTITIELMLRPGLTPDDLVTNTDTVIADEPFDPDACSPNYDGATGECWDETTVSPVRVAALSTVKKVRGDAPVGEPGIPEVYLDRSVIPDGAEVPDDYCDTAADADGFYRAPCVPVTRPGDTETWRFTITNAGTIPVDELVSVDALPIPGDTGVIVTLPRDSEWEPTFADTVEMITDNATAELSVFYTSSHDPCTADLDPLGEPCPDGAWLPYDDTVDDAQVGSLKFQVDFGADLFDPGEQLTLQFQTQTTPDSPADSDFPVAWNTVATGGVSNDNGTRDTVTATEGRKVGVTYPTGPIQLEKIVTGDGAAYAPDTFTVQLVCTVDGESVTGLPELTLTPGAPPTEVDGLPLDAECTATETDQGQTDEVIGTATVGGPEDEIGVVTVENIFELGDIAVTKTVTSDAVDESGDPITYGPFEVAASCEFLGEEVWADGYDTDDPMESEITDGETWNLTGLPVGAECTITEPDSADADVTITPAQPVEVALDDVVLVDVENAYGDGSLHLRKFVPEEVREFPISEGPFTMAVTCVLTDASHPDGEVVYEDDEIVLPDEDNVDNDVMDYQIDNIATGAVCTVSEPDDGAANAHVITPRTITVGTGRTSNVVVTNLFGAGALVVTKTVDGPGSELYGAGPFEVSVECTYTDVNGEEQPLNTPGGPTRELSADNEYTATYDPLLLGSTCTIEETGTGGATTTVITNADGEEIDQFTVDSLTEDVAVGITNTFELGQIRVKKQVVGHGPSRFEVELACTQDVDGTATEVEVPGGPTRTLTAGRDFTAIYPDLPAGAECTLVETDDGDAKDTTITPNAGDPEVGAITVEDGATVRIRVVNEFDPALGPDAGDDDPGDGFGDGLLPDTGSPRGVLALAVLALLLVVGGAVLIGQGRRSRPSGLGRR